MSGRLALLKSATSIGYAVGVAAAAALAGIAAVAKNTSGTHTAIVRHDSVSSVHDAASVVRDSALLGELRGLRHDNQLNAKRERCILVAESTAQKRACQKASFIEGEDQ